MLLSFLFIWWPLLLAASFVLLLVLRRKREYLSGVDSVFVSGDPHNVIVVHAIVTTKAPIELSRFRAEIAKHFASHRRFRQRVVKRAWRWHYFVDEENFDLDQHIRVHQLPKLANENAESLHDQLQAYVSELIQTPIDMTRSPWEFVLIPVHGKGSAFILRVHHSIADGITLMRLSMHAFERVDGAEGAPNQLVSPGTNQSPSSSGEIQEVELRARSASPVLQSSSASASAAPVAVLPPGSFRCVQKFKKPHGGHRTLGDKLSALGGALKKVLGARPDPPSLLKPTSNITPSIPCNARWLRTPLNLAELKQVSYATGTSVNDVLFTLVSAALRQYCLSRKQAVERMNDLKCIMWVSLQGTEVRKEIKFGNTIGAVNLVLPLKASDNLERLLAVRDMTSDLQRSPEPFVAHHLMNVLGLLPQALTACVWDYLAYKATNSMSNVPGPQHAVRFAGVELDRLVFFVPPQGTIASFLTILSYDGAVQFGCLVDGRVVEEPRVIIDFFESEWEALKKQVSKLQEEGTLQKTLKLQDKDKA